MSIFVWLIVGHLIGDWLLQNHWMATNKNQSLATLAGFVHFTIYTIVVVGVLLLTAKQEFSPLELAAFIAIIFITHWLIDAKRMAEQWIRVFRQSDLTMMRVMVDQILHILVLVLVSEIIKRG